MEEQVVIAINPDEQRIVVRGLSDFRNALIREGKPTDDLDDAIIKIATASPKRKRRTDREAR